MTTAVKMSTLTTPTAEGLTAIITTCKIPIPIETVTVAAYKYTKKFMEGHQGDSCRCAPNVAIANCAVQPQVHHLLQIWIKATWTDKTVYQILPKNPSFSYISGLKKYQLNPKTRNIKHTIQQFYQHIHFPRQCKNSHVLKRQILRKQSDGSHRLY